VYNGPSTLASESQITVVILTFNEARHIRRCIQRANGVARRIVVIDSASTDGTQAIARELGAEVYERPFTYHADQLNWGLHAAGVIAGWVLRLDADEYLQPALADEIRERLPTMPSDVSSVEFKLRLIFKGRWVRWGGYYDTMLVRLWKVSAAKVEDKLMDERVSVWEGRTLRFTRGDLVDENLNDIAAWTAKHNGYSTKHMVQFMRRELGLTKTEEVRGKLTDQGARKRFLRDGLYASAPLYVRCVLYFFYRYLFRLGFLDGKQGFVWHVLQGFWHMMLIDVKIAEARHIVAQQGINGLDRQMREIYGLTLLP
jgi:glycosyltransferase involved in cell wall biosynthesis